LYAGLIGFNKPRWLKSTIKGMQWTLSVWILLLHECEWVKVSFGTSSADSPGQTAVKWLYVCELYVYFAILCRSIYSNFVESLLVLLRWSVQCLMMMFVMTTTEARDIVVEVDSARRSACLFQAGYLCTFITVYCFTFAALPLISRLSWLCSACLWIFVELVLTFIL